MTMIWTVSLLCWSLATLLVASLATQSLGAAARTSRGSCTGEPQDVGCTADVDTLGDYRLAFHVQDAIAEELHPVVY